MTGKAAWMLLLLVPLAGCASDEGPEDFRAEGFIATYTRAGEPFQTLVLDGPSDRLDSDLVPRPAYRVRAIAPEGKRPADVHDADYFDGALRMVRTEGCSISSGSGCERYSARWPRDAVDGFDVPFTGAFWPLMETPSLARTPRGSELEIRMTAIDICWVFEEPRPVPIRSCDGDTVLASYEAAPLPSIPAWPGTSTRQASGSAANELFPGADADLQGFGFTTLDALAELKAKSTEAAAKLQAGGCVVTTLLGTGSGAFGSFPLNNVERALANTSFVVQGSDGSRTKYTMQWVENSVTGQRGFSSAVSVNEPDHQGGPTCDEARTAPWPTIPVQEVLAFSAQLGNPTSENLEVSRQPARIDDGTFLRYAFSPALLPNPSVQYLSMNAELGAVTYLAFYPYQPIDPVGANESGQASLEVLSESKARI